VPDADPTAQHDVTDGSECCYFGYRPFGTNVQRVALGVSEGVMATDGQHPDPGIDGVGRDDAEHVPAASNRSQYIAGGALLGADHTHPAPRLPNS
jgi:hypothetical protein